MFDPDLPSKGQPLFEPACASCHKCTQDLLVCHRCEILTYCSKKCQRRDFIKHFNYCKYVNEHKDSMKNCLGALGVSDDGDEDDLIVKLKDLNAVSDFAYDNM